jgi:lipid II:glycine glycyltransferase (peptidoglycan interpeptide bridge formation enzyme)
MADARSPLGVTIDDAPGRARLRAWDDLVRNSPAGDVAQLSGWGRVRNLAGYDPLYVFVERDGDLLGGAQVLLRRLPVLGAFGYVPYGPLAVLSAGRPAAERALTAALDTVGRHHVRGLFVQPPEGGESISAALLERGFRPSDANVAPSASVRVDLASDPAEIRRNLSRRLRGWTNQWSTRGVTVREGTEEDFPTATELHARTAEHHGFAPFTHDYLAALHRELSPGGHFLLLIGEVNGHPGAMGVYTGNGGVLKSRLVGLDRSSEAARFDTVAAIDWAALTWAKRNGYRWFDFAGISPASLVALESNGPRDLARIPGPDRYKLRFGGVLYRYPEPVELIASPLLRLGYDLSRRSSAGRDLVSRARYWARDGTWHQRTPP